jgi:Protein of unknown function with PCYCGC motif
MRLLAALTALCLLAGCGESAEPAPSGAGGTSSQALSCDLGSAFPDSPIIDPDASVYQDENWTQDEVTAAFAQAKLDDSAAYRAYQAARKHEAHMTCAFCACGCAEESGHLSAIDCFKDMHGFT